MVSIDSAIMLLVSMIKKNKVKIFGFSIRSSTIENDASILITPAWNTNEDHIGIICYTIFCALLSMFIFSNIIAAIDEQVELNYIYAMYI